MSDLVCLVESAHRSFIENTPRIDKAQNITITAT